MYPFSCLTVYFNSSVQIDQFVLIKMTKSFWKIKHQIILFAILIMAILLRLIALDKVPNGFFPDEASNAYDAYSILPKYLPLSGFILATSIFTYQSARVFVPLFLLGLSLIYYKFLAKHIIYTFWTVIFFLIIFIPQLFFYLSPQGMTRANDVIFNTNLITIIKCYFHHFSPDFLFFHGDPNPRHLPQNRGELYYFEMLTLPLGLFFSLKARTKKNYILILWLILFPLPAALTTEIHSIRGIMGVIILAIISGYGMSKLLDILNTYIKKIATPILIFTIVISVVFFSHRYFVEYPRWLPEAWLSTMGYIITDANKTNANCIVIDTNIYGEHIYIFVPFYTQLPPGEYQKLGVDVAKDKLDIGRWKVRNLNELKSLNKQCLYITSTQQLVNLKNQGYNLESINDFRDINGQQNYQLLTIKENPSFHGKATR
jgi:hypothetical protein